MEVLKGMHQPSWSQQPRVNYLMQRQQAELLQAKEKWE